MVLSAATSIWFPNLGIKLNNVGTSVSVFGFAITYYGMIIALGMAVGYLVVEWQAKRTRQNPDIYLDFALYAIVTSVIGARLYYVIFDWDQYKDNLLSILNTRNGGLAIYGGIIAAILTVFFYTKIKKLSFGLLADTGCLGLITGQIIGRWGNFFNREAFGKFTDNIFAMRLDIRNVSSDYYNPVTYLSEKYANRPEAFRRIMEIRDNEIFMDGATYIQVHPTFLYESIWNIGVLILLILYTRHKKFDGEVFLFYLFGYGLGRVWIEGLRTDQLFLWGTPIAVSQLLSALLVLFSIIIILGKRYSLKRRQD